MPTYEYKCVSCGIEFERFQRISDDPVKACPECGVLRDRLWQREFETFGGGQPPGE
jgi:putative FmdB family regulatory protein